MDLHIRLNVTCGFSVTLGITASEERGLEWDTLKRVVAQHISDQIANGALPDCINTIEIAEIADDSDDIIVRGTNG